MGMYGLTKSLLLPSRVFCIIYDSLHGKGLLKIFLGCCKFTLRSGKYLLIQNKIVFQYNVIFM